MSCVRHIVDVLPFAITFIVLCPQVDVYKRQPLLLTGVNCVTNNNFKFLVRHDQILLWRNLFDLHYIRLNSPESTGWRREKGLLFRTFFVCVGCSSKENTSQRVAYMKMIPDIHITKTISSYKMCIRDSFPPREPAEKGRPGFSRPSGRFKGTAFSRRKMPRISGDDVGGVFRSGGMRRITPNCLSSLVQLRNQQRSPLPLPQR